MPEPKPKVVVDARWSKLVGGIGRVSHQLLQRLPAYPAAIKGGSPSSPLDVINPSRLRLSGRTVLYNPGYNAGFTDAHQLLTLHDLMHLTSESSALKRAYYERIVAPAIKRTGQVFTVSHASAAAIREWLQTDQVEVRVVYHGLSCVAERGTPPAGAGPRPDGPLRLLYVGNLMAHKNYPTALKALAALREASLTVVTADDAEAWRQAEAVAPGLRRRVLVRSKVTDQALAGLYQEADALLMPSLEEGFGLPALEALAWRKPVLYWEGCTALAEVLGGFGHPVADPTSGSAWAQATQAAIDAPKPDEAALAAWLSQFNWDTAAAQVKDGIDSAVARLEAQA
ncbi:MAG: glycosyltransferase [Bifidobacteriaceae bacterium]|jgi:glycosyltransferase involved in cell wall biosynthesis|nr:glycosyltransferase [Bifidobacteriaceae bacterium]